MAQHFGKLRPCSDVKLGGERSAFRPIKVPETDEEKLESDSGKSLLLVKPTPMIYVNDSELQLSPLSPHGKKFPEIDEEDPAMAGNHGTCMYM